MKMLTPPKFYNSINLSFKDTNGVFWLNIMEYYWFHLTRIPLTNFRNWLHTCFEVDLNLKSLSFSVNGGETVTLNNLTLSMKNPALYLKY